MNLCNRIEAQNVSEASIRDNPIDLLLAIKLHVLDYEESRSCALVISDAFRTFFNFVQENNEDFSDCARRFKAARENL